MGLILFGAEQFASSVEKEIVENSSTYLFGRTETNELRTANYAALTDEIKTGASGKRVDDACGDDVWKIGKGRPPARPPFPLFHTFRRGRRSR
jgi:hypothetical protein